MGKTLSGADSHGGLEFAGHLPQDTAAGQAGLQGLGELGLGHQGTQDLQDGTVGKNGTFQVLFWTGHAFADGALAMKWPCREGVKRLQMCGPN